MQKQAGAFNTALKYASENVLGKKSKNKHASWVSTQTIELLNAYNKATKRYKLTRQEVHNNQWQVLLGQVSADFDLDPHLAALDVVDQKHEHRTA